MPVAINWGFCIFNCVLLTLFAVSTVSNKKEDQEFPGRKFVTMSVDGRRV
jgi:hypothetical protein